MAKATMQKESRKRKVRRCGDCAYFDENIRLSIYCPWREEISEHSRACDLFREG